MTAAPRKPRYLELAEDLRAQILSRALPDNDQFPTESVLCARYGVSRFTVREALRTLQNERLIRRRRGSGTVVHPEGGREGTPQQPPSRAGEILQYANDHRVAFARAGAVVLPVRLARDLGVSVDGRWSRFHGIRTEADAQAGGTKMIAAIDAYIHPDLTAAAGSIDLAGAPISRQLETLAGIRIARVTQDIQAVAASSAIAAALGVARRSPCLRILCCFFDGEGRVVEISASHHPGDGFAYHMQSEIGGRIGHDARGRDLTRPA